MPFTRLSVPLGGDPPASPTPTGRGHRGNLSPGRCSLKVTDGCRFPAVSAAHSPPQPCVGPLGTVPPASERPPGAVTMSEACAEGRSGNHGASCHPGGRGLSPWAVPASFLIPPRPGPLPSPLPSSELSDVCVQQRPLELPSTDAGPATYGAPVCSTLPGVGATHTLAHPPGLPRPRAAHILASGSCCRAGPPSPESPQPASPASSGFHVPAFFRKESGGAWVTLLSV